MNDRERELILGIISEANNALLKHEDNQQMVEAFLDAISVQAANVLYREVLRRHGQAEGPTS